MISRICCKCKNNLSIHKFGIDKSKPLGHKYKCKECESKDFKNRYKDTEFRERHLSYNKRWEQNNREKQSKRVIEWQQTPKGKLSRAKNSSKRRYKLKNTIHSFSYEDWLSKVKLTNGICPRCNKTYDEGAGLTLDHIIPLSRAPINHIYTIDGVQPLCKRCNSKKYTSIEDMF